MAFLPSDIKGMTLWLKARNYPELEFGDIVTYWRDESGNEHEFTAAGPGETQGPSYDIGVNLLPCLNFGSAIGPMDGPDMNLFLGTGPKAIFIAFDAEDITGTQTIITDKTGANKLWLKIMTVAGPPDGAVVPRLRAYNDFTGGGFDQVESKPLTPGPHVAIWQHFGNILRVGLDDPFPDEKAATGTTIGLGAARLGFNNVNGERFGGRIYEIVCVSKVGMQEREVSKLVAYLRNRVLDCGDPLMELRDVLSRRGVANGRSRIFMPVDVPLEFLDYDLLQAHAVSHDELPSFDGLGAGLKRWQRRAATRMALTEQIGARRLSLLLADRQSVGHMYRESGQAEQPVDSTRQGVAISGMGVRRLYNHRTPIYVAGPSGIVMKVGAGVEPGAAAGILQDPDSTNYLPRSSGISGLTGITVTGDGVNGSDVVEVDHDTLDTHQLFGTEKDSLYHDVQTTEHHWKFIAGSPHTADLAAQWSESFSDELIPADSWCCFSFYRLGSAGPLHWSLQRDSDSLWWNDATGTWDASEVFNAALVTGVEIERWRSNPIESPGVDWRATVRLVMPNGLTVDASEVEVFHLQLEPLPFPTSPMPQDNVWLDHRLECELAFIESGAQVVGVHQFNQPRATVGVRLTAPWSMADLASGQHVVPLFEVSNEHPSLDNYYVGRIMCSGQMRVEFAARAGGSEVVAYQDVTPIMRDTEHSLVFRITSEDEGELDLPASTMDVFVDGVKGVSAAISARPVPVEFPRVAWSLFGATVRYVDSDYDVWPDGKIEAGAW